jgi:hypothetical protein
VAISRLSTPRRSPPAPFSMSIPPIALSKAPLVPTTFLSCPPGLFLQHDYFPVCANSQVFRRNIAWRKRSMTFGSAQKGNRSA